MKTEKSLRIFTSRNTWRAVLRKRRKRRSRDPSMRSSTGEKRRRA